MTHPRFPARYFDGRTARAQDVSVSIAADGLSIYRPTGVFLAHWRAKRVVLAEKPRSGEAVRIGLEGTTARLVVEDAGAAAALNAALPRAGRAQRIGRRNVVRIAAWSGSAIAAAAFIVVVLIPLLSVQLARQTPETLKQRIGAATLAQVTELIAYLPGESKRSAYCTELTGELVLQALAERLVRDLPNPPKLRLVAIDAELVNAFALPGGYVVVTSGLLRAAESPEEVAGVLAHEIGHVHHDHPTQAIFRTTAVSLLVSAVIGDFTGGVLIGAISEWAVNSSYSRDAEREADDFAIARLNAADIDGKGFVRFFERLQVETGQAEEGAMRFVSTHPATAERLAKIRAETTGKGVALTKAGWRLLRGICARRQASPPSFPNAAAK